MFQPWYNRIKETLKIVKCLVGICIFKEPLTSSKFIFVPNSKEEFFTSGILLTIDIPSAGLDLPNSSRVRFCNHV